MSKTMTAIFTTHDLRPIHPLHALLLAFAAPMCVGAFLSDVAYASTYQVQWINFAAWLNLGALIGGGLTLAWALFGARDRAARSRRHIIYITALLAMWIVSFVNALVHAKDAWATMPAGLWLSLIAMLLALVASWIGFAGLRAGDAK